MPVETSTVLEGFHFLESPRWHEDRVWFSDFYAHQVCSAREDGSDLRVEAEVPGQPSGLGWLPDGRLLVVSMLDHRLLRREDDGSLVTHADLSSYVSGHLNDLVVDPEGRGYVGNFGFDLMAGEPVRAAGLHRVDPDGSIAEVATDLRFPNGMVLHEGRLLVAETFGNRVSVFDVAGNGDLGERRDWARFADLPEETALETVVPALEVAPDGMCQDAEGALWVADATHQRLLRVLEGGEVAEELDVGTGVFACWLGGADGRTLFACTAPDFLEEARRAATEARLLATRVQVPAR